jgi:microcystin-dependent protein
MASTYSDSLRLELIGDGEQSGAWGVTTNRNLGTLLEAAISGVASVTHDDSANYSLTALNGVSDEARNMIQEIGGTLTADRNVVVPDDTKLYIVKNATSGGFSITVKTSAGTGVTISNGDYAIVYSDGTNVVNVPLGAGGALASLDTVGAAQIDSDAVTTAKILDANVTASKLASDSITTAKIADNNVTTAKIADSNITTAKIADSNITTAKIADSNVTKAKIEDLSDYTVLGNVSGGAAAPAEVSILDEDDLSSDSATALPTQQSVKAYVDTNTGSSPAGSLIAFAGSSAPTGWLLCYGQAVNRTTYAALFAVVGTTYGNGDGSTTFNLPDLRGRAVFGKDDMGGAAASRVTSGQKHGVDGSTLGAAGGVSEYALVEAELAAHQHTIPFKTSTSGSVTADFLAQRASGPNVSSEVAGGDEAHTNMPPFMVINYIIKT